MAFSKGTPAPFVDATTFAGQKAVHVESLEPGLQIFPTEASFLQSAQQVVDHRTSSSPMQDIAPFVIGALAAIPVVGPALAVASKVVFGADQAKQQAQSLATLDPLVSRVVSSLAPAPAPGGSPMFEDFDFSSILNTGADLVGRALAARMQPVAAAPTAPMMMMAAAPAAGGVMAALPSLGGLLGRLGVGGVVAAGAAAAGIVRSAAGRILRVVLPSGVKVSAEAAKKLINAVGWTGAATALGISANELAEWMLSSSGRRRRGKGVTAANIRTTRRTMRTVMGLHRQIVDACSGARVPMRRRAPAVVIAKRCK